MIVVIDRNLCDHVLPTCEQCFARFLRHPMGEDRYCITDYVENGDPMLMLTLKYDGAEEEQFILSLEQCEQMANEGWSQFVKVKPKFYRE